MANLIESSEFGDWLMTELSQLEAQLKRGLADSGARAKPRLRKIKHTKKLLLEFLTLQQSMRHAARAQRAGEKKA